MDEDWLLFQEQAKNIKPLAQDKVNIAKKGNYLNSKERQHSAQFFNDDLSNQLQQKKGIYLSFEHVYMLKPEEVVCEKKEGIQENVFKKFRLGHYSFDASLDLHGRTLVQARDDLIYFINRCYQLNIRAVIVVHGKGERSQPQAQLKSHVSTWLMQFKQVLAIHSAQNKHGGTGALYVMIKKQPSLNANEKTFF